VTSNLIEPNAVFNRGVPNAVNDLLNRVLIMRMQNSRIMFKYIVQVLVVGDDFKYGNCMLF